MMPEVRNIVRLDMADRRATCTCGWVAWAFSTTSARRAAETHASNHTDGRRE